MILKFLKALMITMVVGSPVWAQLQFIPVTPCRVADTRGAVGPFGGPTMTAGMRSFVVPQSACGIPATAQAYSLNVTVVPPARLTYLTLWPTGQSQPYVSTLNSWGGDVVANAAIVPAGVGGAVSVFVTNTTDVILDINGYFAASTDSNAFSFYPATPCRVVDTRGATGQFGGPSMTAGLERDFPVPMSTCAIPATARGYSLNATVVPPGYLGFLTMWPTGQARPNASTLNSWKGKIVANAALVPAGTNESVSVYVSNQTNTILDINGYFGQPGFPGALTFHPVTPCRIADTRNANSPFGGPEMGASTSRTFPIPASVCGIPATAEAYSLNVTVVPDGALAYLTTWPTGSAKPYVSTLNSFDGSVVANAAIVPAGAGGGIDVFVTNPTHVVLDINGYFAGSGGRDTYTITGMVSGLNGGASVGLLDNGTDALTVSANGSFTFPTALASGAGYSVTVGTQPAGEVCQVAGGGSGVVSADVTNVVVTCVAVTHTIGGRVSGLSGGASVVLKDNGTDALTVSANGPFTFATPVDSGATYAVTVGTEPAGESCQVANGGPAVVTANVTNVAVTCATTAPPTNLVAEHALAQTGLSIALASNVLQSQMYVFFDAGTQSAPCNALSGGGSVQTGATPTASTEGHPVYPVTVYYDANCKQPYIAADITGLTQTGDGSGIIVETATYYGLNGTTIGTMNLNETIAETLSSGAIQGLSVNGLGTFTPASGARTPVQLGLSCTLASLFGATNVPCQGAVAQDFPALNLAIGGITQINLNIAHNAQGEATSVSFSGGGSSFTGPIGSAKLTNPSPSSFVMPGGTAFGSTTTSGGAAAFALFPPTPTSWTLTDAAHDQTIQISVIDNTSRNSSITIKQVSTGKTLATGTVDQSGSGSITYSDASTAAITSWTLAD